MRSPGVEPHKPLCRWPLYLFIRVRLKRLSILHSSLAASLLLISCSTSRSPVASDPPGYRAVRAELALGDTSRYGFVILRVVSDGRNRLLVVYEKLERKSQKSLGVFIRLSHDAGASFGQERVIPAVAVGKANPVDMEFVFLKNGVASIYFPSSFPRDLLYTRTDTEGVAWSEPVQVNDEEHSMGHGGGALIQATDSDIYCVWPDARRGYDLIFFASSHDGGRTWSPNQAIDYDFREGAQAHPTLVGGAQGRLLAFWDDGRDRRTLFDIRSSYSDDRGEHWSASQRINDDQEHVWQSFGAAVAGEQRLYTVFSDYRENSAEGDKDCNIYFAESDDNGERWSRNARLNDISDGVDDTPVLALDDQGSPACLWRSCRNALFGQVHFSWRAKKGRGWSTAMNLGAEVPTAFQIPVDLAPLSGGKFLALWHERVPGVLKSHVFTMEHLSAPAVPQPYAPPAAKMPAIPSFSRDRTIFADDFSNGSSQWQAAVGTWLNPEGTYMGVLPGAYRPYSSFARFAEPERYVFEGRFKLDPVHHQMAYIYLRTDPTRRAYYVIGNGFRNGAYLAIKNDDAPPFSVSGLVLDGVPIAEGRFSFKNNRWYTFTLVVSPDALDYYIDRQLLLTYKGRLELSPGAIGLGGFASAPTYFDDIVIYGFESAAGVLKTRD